MTNQIDQETKSLDDLMKDKLEKELNKLAHEEVVAERRFLVGKIIPFKLSDRNTANYFVPANLYLDEKKENLPLTENYSDWNNFFKTYLLGQSRGFLAVGEKLDIIEEDLLQIKTGYNIRHRDFFQYPEDAKLFEVLKKIYSSATLWIPLLHSYELIKRPILTRLKKYF